MKRLTASISISEGDQIEMVRMLMADAIDKLDSRSKGSDVTPDWSTLEVRSEVNFVEEQTLCMVEVVSAAYTIINFEVRAYG